MSKDEQLTYQPPRAMRMGSAATGAGACNPVGSGDPDVCYSPGTTADGDGGCFYPGSNATGTCTSAGSSASGTCETAGSGAGTYCYTNGSGGAART